MNCIICTKLLTGKQTKYCCRRCHNQDINTKHNSYECQQKRGRERKIKLINSKGGQCQVCGYRKNHAALEFHHINPQEKESQLDLRKLSNSTWEWCETEAAKCNLLCANCHRESHFPDCYLSP